MEEPRRVDGDAVEGKGASGAGYVKVEVDERKFSDYVLDPNNSNGKSEIYKSYGYNQSDASKLSQLYQSQAQHKFFAGDYVVGKFDDYGQRITINISIGNDKNATFVKSGWMINNDGSLRLITPFAGFVE